MIVTIKVENCSDMNVAAFEAKMMGMDFKKVDTTKFNLVVLDSWKLDLFMSKIGHAEVIERSQLL